jgi:hypothetical protein
MTKLHEILTHILENEPKLAERECKPEFELVNTDDGQEVRVVLVRPVINSQISVDTNQ